MGPENGCRSYDLQGVEFSYPLAPDNRVLKGVSLSVSPRRLAPPLWREEFGIELYPLTPTHRFNKATSWPSWAPPAAERAQ